MPHGPGNRSATLRMYLHRSTAGGLLASMLRRRQHSVGQSWQHCSYHRRRACLVSLPRLSKHPCLQEVCQEARGLARNHPAQPECSMTH